MARDVVGLLLIVVGLFKIWLGWVQVRSYRVKFARWFDWPPELEWKLAMVFFSVARLFIILGLLIMGGDGPISWWAVAVAIDVAFWHLVLAWGFVRMPGKVLTSAPPATARDEP